MRLARLLLLVPLALAAGCSSFDHHWDVTSMPTSAVPAAPLAGKWEGSWQSDATAYIGNLKAIILPPQSVFAKDSVKMQQYRAEIKMTLYDVFSNEQKLTLNGAPDKDGKRFHFEGQIDRGTAFGGIYHYDGYVQDDVFFCDYTSTRDCGTFLMHRLTLENQSQ